MPELLCISIIFLFPYGLCRLLFGGGIDWIIPAIIGFLFSLQVFGEGKKR